MLFDAGQITEKQLSNHYAEAYKRILPIIKSRIMKTKRKENKSQITIKDKHLIIKSSSHSPKPLKSKNRYRVSKPKSGLENKILPMPYQTPNILPILTLRSPTSRSRNSVSPSIRTENKESLFLQVMEGYKNHKKHQIDRNILRSDLLFSRRKNKFNEMS